MGSSISKMEQVKKLKKCKGIQHLLNEFSIIIENPMLIHDMEYSLIAYTDGNIADDPIWNEFMAHGRLSRETIEFCMRECFIDAVSNCDGVTYLISDKLKYDRIFGQLYNSDHMPVADLCAVAYNKPFDKDAPALIKTICDKLSKELGGDDYYQNYGQTYQESIMRKLIEGTIEDRRLYSGHLANIYMGLKTNIYLVVADIAQSGAAHENLKYFKDLFMRTQPAFKYVIYDNYIVILISTNSKTFNAEKNLAGLYELFEQNSIFFGISSSFENLFEMPIYYNEAVSALKNGL